MLSLSAIPFCGAQTPTPSAITGIWARDGRIISADDLIDVFVRHDQRAESGGKAPEESELKQLNGVDFKPLISAAFKKWHPGNLDPVPPPTLIAFNFRGVLFIGGNLTEVFLPRANLEGANFMSSNASGASFEKANLRGAFIQNADFRKADFAGADLTNTVCANVDFTEAWMAGASLKNARIENCSLKAVNLGSADLSGALYEPKLNSLPSISSLATTRGLDELRFETSEAALVELRGALRDAGLRQREREVNYAVQRERRIKADQSGKLMEPWFQYIFFDLTCKYGMDPGLPLRLLGLGVFIFAIPYFGAILFRTRFKRSGIWVVRDNETVNKPHRKTRAVPVMLEAWTGLGRWGKTRSLLRAARVAFFFSLLSAFSIGFREINVRSWIARLQAREYSLRGTGWVRALAGFQALLSVYLLALWVLTYFGRPFE
jgi:hypothetical protein